MEIALNEIWVGPRNRKQLGDLETLAASMQALGQLQPVLVTPSRKLIAGYRRLEAAKALGWTAIEATVCHTLADTLAALKAERDENTCREDFAPSEAVQIGLEIEKAEAEAAASRQAASRFGGGGKFPPPEAKGKTRDIVGAALGLSGRTYEKAKAVFESGDEGLIRLMDRKSVNSAYRRLLNENEPKDQGTSERPLDSILGGLEGGYVVFASPSEEKAILDQLKETGHAIENLGQRVYHFSKGDRGC